MPRRPELRTSPLARTSWRLGASAVIGLVAAVVVGTLWRPAYAPAVGWDITAILFTGWSWLVIWPLDAADTARRSGSVDPNRAISDVLTLSASVASIAAVIIVLAAASKAESTSIRPRRPATGTSRTLP